MNSYVKFGTCTSKVLLYIVSKNIRLHVCHWWIWSKNAEKREKCSFVCLFDDHEVVTVVIYFGGWCGGFNAFFFRFYVLWPNEWLQKKFWTKWQHSKFLLPSISRFSSFLSKKNLIQKCQMNTKSAIDHFSVYVVNILFFSNLQAQSLQVQWLQVKMIL